MREPGDGTTIQVHLDGLRDLAKQLRQESDRAVGASARRARSTLASGTPFGGTSASGYVNDAKERYHAAAVRALDTMNNYALRAEALAGAVEAIIARYGESDAFARAQSTEIETEIGNAYARARAARETL